jgi:AraC-like DNA-binding protein
VNRRRRSARRPEQVQEPLLYRGAGYPEEPSFLVGTNELVRRFEQVFTQPLIEIGFVLAGRGTIYLDGYTHAVEAGDGYFLDMSHPHRHDPTGAMRNLYVHIKYETLEALAPRDEYARFIQPFLLLQSGVVPPVMMKAERFGAILLEARERYASDDPYGYVLAWSKIIEAFVEIGRFCSSVTGGIVGSGIDKRRNTVAMALQYIGANFAKPITLEQVAAHCRLSQSRFSSVFSAAMHCSPIAFRNRLRINRALEMLSATAMDVQEIAFECGFHSLAQFRTLFRRHTGHTPTEHRKQ